MKSAVRILVVDEDPDVLKATAHLREPTGDTVDRTANATTAGPAVAPQPPALLRLDRHLGGSAGLALCRRFQPGPACVSRWAVIVSATGGATDHEAEGLEAGADCYSVRPIANQEGLARVRACVCNLGLTRTLRLRATEPAQQKDETARVQRATLSLRTGVIAAPGNIARANRKFPAEMALRHEAAIVRRRSARRRGQDLLLDREDRARKLHREANKLTPRSAESLCDSSRAAAA